MARTSELVRVVAVLAHDLAGALGSDAVLGRTVAVLSPVLPIASAALELTDGTRREVTSASDATPGEPVVLEVGGYDRPLGRLVVVPAGPAFDDFGRDLLAIAAVHVGGAIERHRRYEEIAELERLKSDFIARVSHELRTPITILNGYLDTLLGHGESLAAEQRHHMVERSRGAAIRLATLVEELLLLSRLEVGVLTPSIGPVRLDSVLASVRAGMVDPDSVVIGTLPSAQVVADADLLTRALGFVVDNALKHAGAAEIMVRADGPHWAISVRDRGPGFSPEVRPVAFEMFTRGRATTTVPGLGVGLPIARTLVELLSGSIEILEPPDGVGALVEVRLHGAAVT